MKWISFDIFIMFLIVGLFFAGFISISIQSNRMTKYAETQKFNPVPKQDDNLAWKPGGEVSTGIATTAPTTTVAVKSVALQKKIVPSKPKQCLAFVGKDCLSYAP